MIYDKGIKEKKYKINLKENMINEQKNKKNYSLQLQFYLILKDE